MKRSEKERRKGIRKIRGRIKDKELFLSKSYHDTLWKLTKALGRKTDLRLELDYKEGAEGKIAYTDGKMIYMNTVNPITNVFPDLEDRIRSHEGLAAHECGHIRCSDFNRRTQYVKGFSQGLVYPNPPKTDTQADVRAWNEWKTYIKAKDEAAIRLISHTAAYLNNVLEDVYIEGFMCREYPGSVRFAIQKNASALLSKIPTEKERKNENTSSLTIMMDLILRYARSGSGAAEKRYQKQYITALNTCRPIIDKSTGSEDPDIRFHAANSLILKLWKYIKQEIDAIKQEVGEVPEEDVSRWLEDYLKTKIRWISLSKEQKVGEDEAGAVPEDWNGSSEGMAEEEHISEKNEESEADELQKIKKEQENLQNGEEQDEWDITKTAEKILNNIAEEQYNRQGEKELKKEIQKEVDDFQFNVNHKDCKVEIHRQVVLEDTTEALYRAAEPEIKKASRHLQKTVEEILECKSAGKMTGLYMGKRLSRSFLYRQDGRIFEKNLFPGDGFSIAFAVLVDNSYSMVNDDRIEYARMTSLVLYDFCQALAIPVMVYGHTTHYPDWVMSNEVVDIFAYADFDCVDGKDHLRITEMEVGDSNRDGAALRFVGEKLLKREEEIKILVLISDGQPRAYQYSGADARSDLQQVKRDLEKKGVKLFVAAIGEDKEQIEAIYKDGFLNISDLKRMPVKIAGLLTDYIR